MNTRDQQYRGFRALQRKLSLEVIH